MKGNIGGNSKFLKEYNQKVLLDLIRTHKTLSRVELSQLTGLTPTAIGIIVGSLLKSGYIHETQIGESTGGRKPVMLELKPGTLYSIGIDVDVKYIHTVLMDITGGIACEKTLHLKKVPSFKEFIENVSGMISSIMKEAGVPDKNLLGVGISIPGIVNSLTGEILMAPNLQWINENVKSQLANFISAPVYIENESMASAICESWIGECQQVDHFVCINIESGIGAGIYAGGKPYRGANGCAGEIGHVVVDENGPKCGCGNYGCLEVLASTTRVVEKAKKMVRQGVSSTLNHFEDLDDLEFDSIIEAARAGDEASRGILLESARYIGIAIAYLVNIANPSKIVIGKEFVKYWDLVLDHVKGVVDEKALKISVKDLEIVPSKIGEMASTLGAAIIPLKELFGR